MSDRPADDERHMAAAIEAGISARHRTSPNPWVGAVLVGTDGGVASGATHPPGGPHAERVALDGAVDPRGATLYSTLEPCSHTGRTSPCVDAIVAAEVARVVVAVEDPDPQVAGEGIARLRAAGIPVDVGAGAPAVEAQLAPYLHHRRTGRPWVVLKSAITLDGRTAAPDGTSQWITGPEARADTHRLRAESDAIIVGAGTVRADDPSLTVRDWPPAGSGIPAAEITDPRRIVLGEAGPEAKVHPCREWSGELTDLLDELGADDVVQVLVEGGATVAAAFHRAGLIDRHVVYVAPALFAGDDAVPLFAGPGSPTMADVWRGEFVDVVRLGADLRIDVRPPPAAG